MRARLTMRLSVCSLALLCSVATAQVPVQSSAPAPETDVAAPTAPPPSLRPDERRASDPVEVALAGRPVTLGFSWERTQERRLGYDLDARSQRGRDVLDDEVKLDARRALGERGLLFVQVVALAERRVAMRDGAVQKRHWFERGQTWLQFGGLGDGTLSLQIGRVALIDRRAWWWDDDLDAVRLGGAWDQGRFDTGLARELFKRGSSDRGIDPALRGVTRWFGHVAQAWRPDHTLEGYGLALHDGSGTPAPGSSHDDGTQDGADARLRWLGLRATGDWRSGAGHRLGYRTDLATLRGSEARTAFRSGAGGQRVAGDSTRHRLRGWAMDVGASWRLPGALRPTFSVGRARGSGGPEGQALDRNFRQTGLHENKARVAGVKRMRLYGELLRPDLSNLQVTSAGFGLRMLERSSVELMVHHYRQLHAAGRVAGARLSVDPLGSERRLGREADLLVALREWQHLELTLTLGAFRPGPAYAADRRDTAHVVELGATLNF